MLSTPTHKEKIFDIFHYNKDIFIHNKKWRKYHIREILNESLKVATYLQKKWYKEWDSIWLISSSGRDYIVWFIGILLAKCVITIIDPYFHNDIITAQLKQCNTKCILINRTIDIYSKILFWTRLIQYLKGVYLWFLTHQSTFSIRTILDSSDHKDYKNSLFDDTLRCSYIPTWWTTDLPKIVIYSYKSFLQSIERISQLPIVWENFLADLPYLWIIWLLLWKSVYFYNTVQNIQDILSYIKKKSIDILFLPPSKLHWKYNIQGNIKTILLWSAPIYTSFLQQLKTRIWSDTKVLWLYGMTECLPISRYHIDQKLQETKEDFLWVFCAGIEIKTQDNELLIKQNGISDGYVWIWKEEYIQTGDMVSIEDNKLYMLGRKKNMIIVDGVNIYPSLYEWLYLAIPWVKKSVLFWVYDKKSNDELLIIAIELDQWVHNTTIIKAIKKIKLHKNIVLHDIMIGKIPTKWRQQKINYSALQLLYLSQHHD